MKKIRRLIGVALFATSLCSCEGLDTILDLIPSPPDRVTFWPSAVQLEVGETVQTTWEAYWDNSEIKHKLNPYWESDDPGIASVSKKGLITAVSPGVTDIIFHGGGFRGTCKVVVLKPYEYLPPIFKLLGDTLYISPREGGERYPEGLEMGRLPEEYRNVSHVVLSEGIVYIKSSAFDSCTALTSVSLPSTLQHIESCAFRACTNLTDISLPTTLSQVDGYVFEGCSSLTDINIPGGIFNQPGHGVLSGCTALTRFTIPTDWDNIPMSTFEGCTGLTAITIPEWITSIYAGAFRGCSSLTEIILPVEVSLIDFNTFKDCTGLTKITLSDSTIRIRSGAFSGCTGLTAITLPQRLWDIEDFAFNGCLALKTVTCLAVKPPGLPYPEENFTATGDTLRVPAGSLAHYKNNAGWSAAFSVIEAIP